MGVVWDSITMQAQLSPARVESILNALKNIKLGQRITVHYLQRVLGLMAAASTVIPLGLLHMRSFQLWLRARGFHPRANPQRQIRVTRQGLRTLSMWFRPRFLFFFFFFFFFFFWPVSSTDNTCQYICMAILSSFTAFFLFFLFFFIYFFLY